MININKYNLLYNNINVTYLESLEDYSVLDNVRDFGLLDALKVNNIHNKSDIMLFNIEKNNKSIGIIALIDVNYTNKNACLHGFVYHKNDTISLKEASYCILRLAFEELKFEKIYIKELDNYYNVEYYLLDIWNEMGFIFEGLLRNHFVHGGRAYNIQIMSMLSHEYFRVYLNNQNIENICAL